MLSGSSRSGLGTISESTPLSIRAMIESGSTPVGKLDPAH